MTKRQATNCLWAIGLFLWLLLALMLLTRCGPSEAKEPPCREWVQTGTVVVGDYDVPVYDAVPCGEEGR